jgi:hypothetical protein
MPRFTGDGRGWTQASQASVTYTPHASEHAGRLGSGFMAGPPVRLPERSNVDPWQEQEKPVPVKDTMQH